MKNKFEFSTLDIVGYSDRITLEWCPIVVPPIYNIIGTNNYIVPPYHYEDNFVVEGVSIELEQLKEMEMKKDITVFDAIDYKRAQKGYELWVNEEFEINYQPVGEVKQYFANKATILKDFAENALKIGDLNTGAMHANKLAMISNDSEVIALNAAIGKLQGNDGMYKRMKNIFIQYKKIHLFDGYVQKFLDLVPKETIIK